jgi:hypothetical protein
MKVLMSSIEQVVTMKKVLNKLTKNKTILKAPFIREIMKAIKRIFKKSIKIIKIQLKSSTKEKISKRKTTISRIKAKKIYSKPKNMFLMDTGTITNQRENKGDIK